MHCYLADGFWGSWLANIERLRGQLASRAELHFGQGEPTDPAPFDWQQHYIETFIEAVSGAD